jgi:ataxia telangiectasia mutated family protein
VLEFVEDAAAFGEFIRHKNKSTSIIGAHSRYYPGEWSDHRQCFKPFEALQFRDKPKPTREEKRELLDEILNNYSPVFRYFFIERFGHSAEAWYTARLRYTLSVAVTSVVGHILGIGDRHTSNIMVHQKTGEVVHIDFGYAFGQGKVRFGFIPGN